MSAAGPSIRKRRLEDESALAPAAAGEIAVAAEAAVAYSSEDPAHPVEHLFDGRCGAGATRWRGARPDTTERIEIVFDTPRAISRILFEAEEAERERTQQVRIEASTDGAQSWRQVLAQDFTFSPGGATFQREDLRFDLRQLTHLRLTIVPNKGGSGHASLTALRLFA